MESNARTVVSSGIEPVDRLLGGLESGSLYLVHGETSDSSLFGLKFLIEGVRRGENAALIVRYPPENAVRRFARLGYDCLEDVKSGRLLILEFADEIIHQVTRLRDLSPTLRALGGLLDETRPARVVFDTITDLVVSEHGNVDSRIREFAAWAQLLGSTSLLIANGNNDDVIQSFWPLIRESFRFERKAEGTRTVTLLAFEKSNRLDPQPIEVDPAKGIFLAALTQQDTAHTESGKERMDAVADAASQDVAEIPGAPHDEDQTPATKSAGPQTPEIVEQPARSAAVQPATKPEPSAASGGVGHDSESGSELRQPETASQSRVEFGSREDPSELNDWLDDLIAWAIQSPANEPRPEKKHTSPSSGIRDRTHEEIKAGSHIVEELLRPPDFEAAVAQSERYVTPPEGAARVPKGPSVHPHDFRVLIIDSDPSSSELLLRGVSEYTVETARDEVGGLTMLISFRPDLVILDLDLPSTDGFRVLTHIRASLNVPIIVVSGLYVRSSDRIRSTELGADYYLTKPFSVKELRQKARQLIARHRGISEWITTAYIDRRDAALGWTGSPSAMAPSQGSHSRRDPTELGQAYEPVPQGRTARARGSKTSSDQFVSYSDFVGRVEGNVKAGMEGGSTFSIVGCRIPQSTNDGTVAAVKLYGILLSIVRAGDVISMNQRNDLVVLLQDADAAGAKAFVGRLLDRVKSEMNEEPLIWLRSFPHLEEATELGRPATGKPSIYSDLVDSHAYQPKQAHAAHPATPAVQVNPPPPATPARPRTADKTGLRESYIDLLKKL